MLQSRKRLLLSKRRKLEVIAGNSSPKISPIPNVLSPNVRKVFQVPRRVTTKPNNENEEE